MRTIVQELPHRAPTVEEQLKEAAERFAFLNSGEAMDIELQTPFECRELLPTLQELYETQPKNEQAAARAEQISDHLKGCTDPKLDPYAKHKPFLISLAETKLLISTFKSNVELRRNLVASVEIGSLSVLGMLEGEIGKAHKGRYLRERCKKAGKIALRALT